MYQPQLNLKEKFNMEWFGVVALLGFLVLLIKVTGDSKWVKKRDQRTLREADKWIKKNKKYVAKMKRIEDKYINEPADKYVFTPVGFILKAALIIAGIGLLMYVLSAAAGGLVSLYYGSPFLFLFLMWLIFFRPRN
jgi:hypothetical protein